MTKPAIIHLISEIPEPAAYGANALTRLAAVKAKSVYKLVSIKRVVVEWAMYRKYDIEYVIDRSQRSPWVPISASWKR